MRSVPLIAISGQRRNGKNEIASYLCRTFPRLNLAVESFAGPVKELTCELFNVDMKFVEEWKLRDENPPGLHMPMREILKFIGNGFRKADPDIWVKRALPKMQYPAIFADCRYPNEMRTVREENGFNIFVLDPNKINEDECDSERFVGALARAFFERGIVGKVEDNVWASGPCEHELPDYFEYIDVVVWNTGDLKDLYNNVDRYVLPEMECWIS